MPWLLTHGSISKYVIYFQVLISKYVNGSISKTQVCESVTQLSRLLTPGAKSVLVIYQSPY